MGQDVEIDAELVVVYDLDEITNDLIDVVRRFLGGRSALHLRRADAQWPSRHDVASRAFPSRRSVELLNYAMERVGDIRRRVRERIEWRSVLEVSGVDLSKVALFDLQFAGRDAFLRDWLCRRIVRAGCVQEVVWVMGSGRFDHAFVRHVEATFQRSGIQFTAIPGIARIAPASLTMLRFKNLAVTTCRSVWAAAAASLRRKEHIPRKERPRIVFVENYPKSAKLAAMVALEAQSREDVDVWFVVTRPDAKEALAQSGLRRLVLLEDIVNHRTWFKGIGAQWRVNRFAAQLSSYLEAGDEPEDPVGHFEGPQLSHVAAAHWGRAALMTTLFEDTLSRLQPDAIATTSQINVFATAAVAVGRKFGAVSYFIQHGGMAHDAPVAKAPHDRFLLWGEWDRKRRLRLGVGPDRIEVTGPPGFGEKLQEIQQAGSNPWSLRGPLKIAFLPGLTAGTWVSAENAELHLRMVLEACEGLDGVELIIKPHPADRSSIFDSIEARSRPRVRRDVDALRAIGEADVVIVTATSAGFDACALDKPVLVLRLEGERVIPQYEGYGAVLFARTFAEVQAQILALREDPILRDSLRLGRARMNEDLFAGARPGAARRISDAIVRGAQERFGEANGDSGAL